MDCQEQVLSDQSNSILLDNLLGRQWECCKHNLSCQAFDEVPHDFLISKVKMWGGYSNYEVDTQLLTGSYLFILNISIPSFFLKRCKAVYIFKNSI